MHANLNIASHFSNIYVCCPICLFMIYVLRQVLQTTFSTCQRIDVLNLFKSCKSFLCDNIKYGLALPMKYKSVFRLVKRHCT